MAEHKFLKELELDRAVTIHLSSGQTYMGAISESADDELVLLTIISTSWATGRQAFVHISYDHITSWVDHRDTSGVPLNYVVHVGKAAGQPTAFYELVPE